MLLATLLLPTISLGPGAPPPPPLMPPYLHLVRELGLSESQSAQLKELLEAHHPSMEAKHDAERLAQKALMEAVRKGSGDLVGLHRTASAAQLALLQEAQQINAAALAVLTPEQREQVAAMKPPPPREERGGAGNRDRRPPQGGPRD